LTRPQKTIFLILTIVIALTRLLAVSRSLFDWDEALFSHGVREYNVMDHHPHPPGYPLFILAAKAFHLLGVPEFRSLQVVVILGAFCIFPALFFMARELGFDFATAAGGAAIFSFLPNVWVYSGTGFSDIPATAVCFAACALLLRGRRDARAFLLGAILLGVAAGFRPTNLLIGLVPALMATWSRLRARSFGSVILAIALGGAVAAGSYAGAALASGSFERYVEAVRAQSKWVHDVDSYHNPYRAPLHDVAKVFFLWPVNQRQQMVALAALALIALVAAIVKRRTPPLLLFAMFVPFAIVAWLNLDVETAARYAIPYMSVHAVLAADALGLIVRRRANVQAALCALVAAVFAVWTWSALRLQRTSDSPPVAALEWVLRNVPAGERVYVNGGIGPQGDLFLGGRPNTVFFEDQEKISLLSGEAWVVDLKVVPDAHNFVWPHSNRLWKIIRRRNFETSVGRVASRIGFGAGWQGDEGSFRWMSGESVSMLPVFRGNGKLRLRIYVPIDTLPAPPVIEVRMNGATVDRFTGSQPEIDRTWTVPSRAGALNELRILTSATVNPARMGRSDDTRDLGLRIDAMSWSPAP